MTELRQNASIDWTVRESARAGIKVMVRRILKKQGLPPDLQDEATQTVLAQAELLSAIWAAVVFYAGMVFLAVGNRDPAGGHVLSNISLGL